MAIIREKGGWLKIVEATLSIMLMFGAVLIFYQISNQKSSESLGGILPVLADEIAKNETLRSEIIALDTSNASETTSTQEQIHEFAIAQLGRNDINIKTAICSLNDSCTLPVAAQGANSSIFSYERIISTSLTKENFDSYSSPKKIRLYLWRTE